MKLGSLFSGYGGLDLAIQAVFNARTVWHCEFEDAPSKVLAHHWPDVPNLGDITKVDWAAVEPVDIIAGGSPCQDLSAAGKRAGMTDGTRSNLWVQMREAIEIIKPRFVVWENVMGALSATATPGDLEQCEFCMDDSGEPRLRALGRVLGDLAEIGYDTQWTTIRASDVGAPHGRARVFLLAHTRGTTIREHPTGSPTQETRAASGHRPSDHHGKQPHGKRGPALELLPTPTTQDGANNGGPSQLERNTPPLNATVTLLPTPTAVDGNTVAQSEWDKSNPKRRLKAIGSELGLLPTPTASAGEKGGPNQRGSKGDLTISSAVHHTDFGQYAPAIERWEFLTDRPAPAPTQPSKTGKPQLSPNFVEWMMGLPDGWVTGVDVTRAQALKMLGNGVVPQQAAAALRQLLHTAKESP